MKEVRRSGRFHFTYKTILEGFAMRLRIPQFILLLSTIFAVMVARNLLAKEADNSAATPAVKPGAPFLKQHEAINKRVAEGNVDLIFVGDSITARWAGDGKDVWQKYYAKRNAGEFGDWRRQNSARVVAA